MVRQLSRQPARQVIIPGAPGSIVFFYVPLSHRLKLIRSASLGTRSGYLGWPRVFLRYRAKLG